MDYLDWNVHYGTIKDYDIADGEGVRVALFLSGCSHQCYNCFNQETWDPLYGKVYTQETEDHLIEAVSKPWIQGITILGGDPLYGDNPKVVFHLLMRMGVEVPGKDIWLYTGDTIKEIATKIANGSDIIYKLLQRVDVLVEGPYVDKLRDLSLKFRGSSNQRILEQKDFLMEISKLLYEGNLQEE